MSTNSPSIRDQVWRAVDPTGENRALINAAIHGSSEVPDFLRRIGVDVGESWGQLALLSAEYRRSIEGIEAAVRVLGPRGWAVMTWTRRPCAALSKRLRPDGATRPTTCWLTSGRATGRGA